MVELVDTVALEATGKPWAFKSPYPHSAPLRRLMSIFFGLREGWWKCWSEKDSRWNMEGRGYVGMLTCPPACERAIEEKKKELAAEPPDDLTYSYIKD